MKKQEIIDKLRIDEHYYGKFGQQYLSNSNIKTLLKNPLDLHKPTKSNPNFLVGGYFHTAILEPDKIKSFKIEIPKCIKKCQAVNYVYYNMKLT
jgi:hypothetical protein